MWPCGHDHFDVIIVLRRSGVVLLSALAQFILLNVSRLVLLCIRTWLPSNDRILDRVISAIRLARPLLTSTSLATFRTRRKISAAQIMRQTTSTTRWTAKRCNYFWQMSYVLYSIAKHSAPPTNCSHPYGLECKDVELTCLLILTAGHAWVIMPKRRPDLRRAVPWLQRFHSMDWNLQHLVASSSFGWLVSQLRFEDVRISCAVLVIEDLPKISSCRSIWMKSETLLRSKVLARPCSV